MKRVSGGGFVGRDGEEMDGMMDSEGGMGWDGMGWKGRKRKGRGQRERERERMVVNEF